MRIACRKWSDIMNEQFLSDSFWFSHRHWENSTGRIVRFVRAYQICKILKLFAIKKANWCSLNFLMVMLKSLKSYNSWSIPTEIEKTWKKHKDFGIIFMCQVAENTTSLWCEKLKHVPFQESALWGAFDAFDCGTHDGKITLDDSRHWRSDSWSI